MPPGWEISTKAPRGAGVKALRYLKGPSGDSTESTGESEPVSATTLPAPLLRQQTSCPKG
jgi:hypothetical protein